MAIAGDSQKEQAKRDYRDIFISFWRQMPSAQIVSNWLLAAFTFCLVVLGYVTEEPYIIPRVQPMQHFGKGETPEELMIFENIGSTPAYSFKTGMAIAVFPYPLGRMHGSAHKYCPPESLSNSQHR
jgi:spore maturation protein CgeB